MAWATRYFAIEHLARAIRLSPIDPFMPQMQHGMAHAYFFADRYQQAISWAHGAD
jgi:hypothetical protein